MKEVTLEYSSFKYSLVNRTTPTTMLAVHTFAEQTGHVRADMFEKMADKILKTLNP